MGARSWYIVSGRRTSASRAMTTTLPSFVLLGAESPSPFAAADAELNSTLDWQARPTRPPSFAGSQCDGLGHWRVVS